MASLASVALWGGMLLCLFASTWLRSGTYAPWQKWLLVGGVLVWAGTGMRLWRRRQRVRGGLLTLALLFLLLLVVQYLNAGRLLYLHALSGQWQFALPAVSWLTSAVTRTEAFEMLCWFVPAAGLMVAVREALHASERRAVLWGVLINGTALGLFAGWLRLVEAPSLYGLFELDGEFIGPFTYDNHAATFFTMLEIVTVGLFARTLQRYAATRGHRSQRDRLSSVVLGVMFAVALLAASMSFSRFGLLGSWGVAVASALWLMASLVPRLSSSARFSFWVVACGALLVGALAIWSFWEGALGREVCGMLSLDAQAAGEARWWQVAAAFRILGRAPWCGVGGWGYGHFLRLDPVAAERDFQDGAANVHCDPVQFLCEFGIVGALLLGGITAVLVWQGVRALRARREEAWHPVRMALLLACLLGWLHSLVDLPFRAPAVLLPWVVFLTLAGVPLEDRNRRSGTAGPAPAAPKETDVVG